MTHDHSSDNAVMFTQEFWDARYGSAEMIWSGAPNRRLVEQVADLLPGTALDVGCGEGADAIWLAGRGWQVTGVDVSSVALRRAAERARAAGDDVAERITWQQANLLSWDPAPQQFDLVSAQFMYLPQPALESLHRRLVAAVRPGGALLIVGHHPSDLDVFARPPDLASLLFTADEIAALLDPDDWQIVAATAPARQMPDADGQLVTMHDAVMHAVRRE